MRTVAELTRTPGRVGDVRRPHRLRRGDVLLHDGSEDGGLAFVEHLALQASECQWQQASMNHRVRAISQGLRCALVPDSAVAGPTMILLVRHGATEWSENGRHTGRTDVPLIEKGRASGRPPAAAAGDALGGCLPTGVLQPARAGACETARRAVPGVEATIVDALAEYDYGNYEGLTAARDRREATRLGPVRRRVPRWREPAPGHCPLRLLHRQARTNRRATAPPSCSPTATSAES